MKALACELPDKLGLPLSRFSRSELRRQVLEAGIVADISGVTIWRWLHEDPLRPWSRRGPGRMMLEAGLVGGSGAACPGQYVGITGRLAGPVSLYGMVETYRCADVAGSANRIGTSVRPGRDRWCGRPAVRADIEYDGGDVSPTAGASLTFGRRYGARFIVRLGEASGGTLTLFQMGGYISF